MHNRQPSWEPKELPNISTQTIQSPPPVNPTLPSAPRDFQECPGPWSPRGDLPHPWGQRPLWLPPLRGQDIHTKPPARFLTPLDARTCPCSSCRGGSRPREAGGTPQLGTEHPQTQPGEQKEEGGGLPLEGRLCLVCRDEKVPMTAPMAAKTCVRLGTPCPAPPLPWKEICVAPLLRIGGGKKKKHPAARLPAAWYSASVGLGRWEPFLSFFSPAHALTHRASRSRRAFGTGPGRFARHGPRTLPRSLVGAGHGAARPPAEAPEPAARAVREPRSARPCCRALRSPPGARAGSRGPGTNHE